MLIPCCADYWLYLECLMMWTTAVRVDHQCHYVWLLLATVLHMHHYYCTCSMLCPIRAGHLFFFGLAFCFEMRY